MQSPNIRAADEFKETAETFTGQILYFYLH